MDWLTFIVEIVKALAWPAGMVVAIAFLRKPLTALIPQLREFRYRNFRLTFGRKLEQLERRADKVGLPLPEKQPQPPKPEGYVVQPGLTYYVPVPLSPRLVVVQAWMEIEKTLLESAVRHGIERQRGNIRDIARQLEARGPLSHDVVALIDELKAMRNRAVHEPDLALTPELAEEFQVLAGRVVAALKAANSRGSS